MDPHAGRKGVAALGLALALAAPHAWGQEPRECPSTSIAALAEHLPGARRFVVVGPVLVPIVALWPVAPELAERLHPDGATLFARDGRPALVALTRAGCVVGAFEADWAAVSRSLREALGPAI